MLVTRTRCSSSCRSMVGRPRNPRERGGAEQARLGAGHLLMAGSCVGGGAKRRLQSCQSHTSASEPAHMSAYTRGASYAVAQCAHVTGLCWKGRGFSGLLSPLILRSCVRTLAGARGWETRPLRRIRPLQPITVIHSSIRENWGIQVPPRSPPRHALELHEEITLCNKHLLYTAAITPNCTVVP